MFILLKKEISGFFSSLTGYIVIVVFLIVNGLFMWVFKGDLNVLDNGYSTLETLFIIAPWVFLFLVPAITMRMFSEEKRSGTIELLLTRPLNDMEIILAKYLAAILLILLSLLPTLIYFWSVIRLGSPPGNIDTGGTWGSYIGLFFLSGIYAAIGLFISSTTENQIVAFIVTVLISFFFYIGFESITSFDIFGNLEKTINNLGIQEHYRSMSRGVIDTRDIVYFISMIAVFLLLTKMILQSRKW